MIPKIFVARTLLVKYFLSQTPEVMTFISGIPEPFGVKTGNLKVTFGIGIQKMGYRRGRHKKNYRQENPQEILNKENIRKLVEHHVGHSHLGYYKVQTNTQTSYAISSQTLSYQQ
jgi:hypothetical protein